MKLLEILTLFLVMESTDADAYVAKSVADYFEVTCIVYFTSENVAMEKTVRELRVMFDGMKTVTIRNLRLERTRYRYNSQRCSQMMHLIDGRPNSIRFALQQVSHSMNLGGPIWLIFLPETYTAEEYFQNAYIPFDSNFIAVETRDSVILRQVYRVSMRHAIRSAPFGNWSADGGLIVDGEYSPCWRRNDLEGKVFKVSAIESWPMATVEPDSTIGGYFGRVWKELEERLNFSTVYVEPKDFATGFWKDEKWNGLMGMISRSEIDAAVSEVTMTPERIPEVDFLKPLYTTRYQLFFKSTGTVIQWDLILRPFRTEVWLTLFLWSGFLAFLLNAGYRIGLRYGLEDPKYKREYESHRCFFFVASAFGGQSNAILPKSGFCRMVFATTYIFSTVVLIIYSCILTSMAAVERPSRPFDSLESFLRDGTYTLHQIPGSDAYAYFSNSTDPLLQEIYRTKFAKLPEKDLPNSHREALDRVCKGEKIAHLGEFGIAAVSANELLEKEGCRFILLDRPLKLLYLTIAVTKDSPYRNAFDYQIGQMTVAGILNRFRGMNFPLWSKINDVTFHPISIEQTAQVNLLLVAGTLASVLVFLIEFTPKRNQN